MKNYFKTLFLLGMVLFVYSCNAQMVQKISETKKLINKKELFIGKPLKLLLKEIKPEIKWAFGDLDDTDYSRLSSLSLIFHTREEYNKLEKNGGKPISLILMLEKDSSKTYPKLAPRSPWTDKQTKIYGDLIVMRLGVLGKDE